MPAFVLTDVSSNLFFAYWLDYKESLWIDPYNLNMHKKQMVFLISFLNNTQLPRGTGIQTWIVYKSFDYFIARLSPSLLSRIALFSVTLVIIRWCPFRYVQTPLAKLMTTYASRPWCIKNLRCNCDMDCLNI